MLLTLSNVSRSKNLVRAAGLEPARNYFQRILSPLRLPLRHARTISILGLCTVTQRWGELQAHVPWKVDPRVLAYLGDEGINQGPA